MYKGIMKLSCLLVLVFVIVNLLSGCDKNIKKVEGITLDRLTLILEAGGETGKIIETIIPEDAKNKSVTWHSSDESVATVADGVVTPVKEGTAIITATTAEGNYSEACNVTVKETDGAVKQIDTIDNLVSAVSDANPGDIIVLKDGTYSGANIILKGYGTPENMITIKAETPGGVIFTQSNLTLTGEYVVFQDFRFNNCSNYTLQLVGASYCRVSNNYFYQCGSSNYGIVLPMMLNSHHNRIDHNTFDASRSMSVRVTVSTSDPGNLLNKYNQIDHNYFKDIPAVADIYPGVNNGLESVQIGQSKDHALQEMYTIIEHNLFDNVKGDKAEMISIKTSANIIRYNTFMDSESMITLRQGNDNIVDGNFFFNCKGGIRVFGLRHIIKNNYIQQCSSGGSGNWYSSINIGNKDSNYVAADFAQVINNTIINSSGKALVIGQPSKTNPKNVLVKNNLISISEGQAIGESGGSEVNYISNIVSLSGTAKSGKTGNGIVELFVDVYQDGNLYRPQNNSAVINAGSHDSNINDDMDGQIRTDNPDIGADEISDTEVKRSPMTISDAGCNHQ